MIRRVFEGGEGVIRGGRSDRSIESGLLGPDDRRLDDSEDCCDVCKGENDVDSDAILTVALQDATSTYVEIVVREVAACEERSRYGQVNDLIAHARNSATG